MSEKVEASLLLLSLPPPTNPFLLVPSELYFPQLVPCFTCYNETTFKRNDKGEACVCDFSQVRLPLLLPLLLSFYLPLNFFFQRGSKCGRAPKGCPKSTCTSADRKKFCGKSFSFTFTFLSSFSYCQDLTDFPPSSDASLSRWTTMKLAEKKGEKQVVRSDLFLFLFFCLPSHSPILFFSFQC
jgi:hypothetical protein